MSNSSASSETFTRSCPICEACCGLRVEVNREAKKVLSVRGDEDDPRSRGYVCPKATAVKGLYEDPDRIKKPLRKTADGWEEISWEEAYAFAGERLKALREAHGKDTLATYIGNPIGHCASGLITVPMYIEAMQSERLFSAASMDQQPKNLTSSILYGDMWAISVPDIQRTDYMLSLGGNQLVSQGSLMSAPNAKKQISDLQRRGGRLVVMDPRRTETAEVADEHHFIVPGSDAFFLFALVNVLFEEGLTNLGHLAPFTDDVDRVRELAAPFSPESVADVTGVPAEVIRRIAREFAAADRAVCYGRIGTCIQEFGTLASWLVDVVNVLTGNLDREGGSMFTRPATGQSEYHMWDGAELNLGRWKSRVRGLPEYEGQLPIATFAEELEDASAGDDRARALVTICGNPVLSSPNGARLASALDELDFMVSIDIYLNETTRHADLILPTTVAIEHSNYDFLFSGTAVRNFARYTPQILEPEAELPDLGDVMLEVAARANGTQGSVLDMMLFEGMLGALVGKAGTPCEHVSVDDARPKLSTEPGIERLLDIMIRTGPYGDAFDDASDGLNLAKIAAEGHAMDLGPLEPRLPGIIRKDHGRLKLVHEIFEKDIERLHESLEARRAPDRLVLIGRRQLQNMNTWLHNLENLAKGKERCTLLVNPTDATRLGLETGGTAKISSRAGSVTAPVEVSDEMMPGVVSLPHGYGHRSSDTALRVANTKQPGANANQLLDEYSLDVPSGTSIANGILVEVAGA
ncbi:MAG: molybdopterin-dependent oxidoreductase [Myxococcota bacterium]|jgi:anaerobic selenocysteine-containing dehydrogenase|nr:molybdopterin-dependent oxidoreductase [Myxococcota bacterium]